MCGSLLIGIQYNVKIRPHLTIHLLFVLLFLCALHVFCSIPEYFLIDSMGTLLPCRLDYNKSRGMFSRVLLYFLSRDFFCFFFVRRCAVAIDCMPLLAPTPPCNAEHKQVWPTVCTHLTPDVSNKYGTLM